MENTLKNLIRVGCVSSVNIERMTAKVVFGDKDNLVSADLKILNRGSKRHKDYFIPEINEQVVWIVPQNSGGKGSNSGFIVGSFFNKADAPVKTGEGLRRVDDGSGSFIEFDNGSITISAAGSLILKGATVEIN